MTAKFHTNPSLTCELITTILNECEGFMFSVLGLLKNKFNDFSDHQQWLDANQREELLDNFEFENPFEVRRTLEQQVEALRENFNFIESEEVLLGYNEDLVLDKGTCTYEPKMVLEKFQYVKVVDVLTMVLSNDIVREAILNEVPSANGVLVSRDKYLKQYEAYKAWCRERGTPYISEDSLLVYVWKLPVEDGYVASTIKAYLSMVKACIKAFDGVDIGAYVNVNSYVRTASKRHKPKKARILTAQQLHQFCNVAPDAEFFLIKVILIIGVIGCCRKSELLELQMAYVTVTDTSILIDIPPEVTENNTADTFSIVGPFHVIVKRYLEARKNIDNEKFFLLYRDGTFINSACGDRTIGALPKTVGEFLGSPEPERYTSHSIRRSSSTVYAESGCTDTELRLHGRWKSTSCASGYSEDTDYRRHKVSAQITNAIIPEQALQDQTISVFSNHQNIFPKTAKNPLFPKTAKKLLSHLARNKSTNSSATVTSGMSSDITAPCGQRNSPILSNSITSARQQLSKFVRKPFTGTNKTVSSGMANIFSAPLGQHHSTSSPTVANRAAVVMQVPTASTHVTVAGPMLA
ncbi:hypothetical protein QAD02_006352 [Eretmocerus hayati]|uniref:Uncharacterized protein n=1 Tax=Eretmocerus hayati TaxID=131215 RepID=A0ACC2N0N6_9HYME|nr:hypothetical protein QAD02_006352 [Eretmocerus hayati]